MPDYMTGDDLGVPGKVSFRASGNVNQLAADVRRLEALWGTGGGRIDREDWQRSWKNIRALACRLLDSIDPQGKCDPETFHHLLMSVGNFKRQAGTIHLPVDLPNSKAGSRSKYFELPEGFGRLDCHDPTSWKRLEKIPGLAIPTASCLLAALWPADHVIMDIYDRRAAVGFQIGCRSGRDSRLDKASIPSRKWCFYDWFRQTVKLTADAAQCEPVQVERALYLVGARTARKLGKVAADELGKVRDWTWSDYYCVALGQVTA